MRIRVDNPALISDLVEFLQASPDVVVEVVGENEAEVSLVGSYRVDMMRMELFLRVRAWEAAQSARGALVELIEDPA